MLQDLPLVALMEARAQVWIINAYISNQSITHITQAAVVSVSYQVPSINLDTIEYSQVWLTTRMYHVPDVTHRDQLQSWYHRLEAALLDGVESMRNLINTVYWRSKNAIIGWLAGWLAGWPLVGSWYLSRADSIMSTWCFGKGVFNHSNQLFNVFEKLRKAAR